MKVLLTLIQGSPSTSEILSFFSPNLFSLATKSTLKSKMNYDCLFSRLFTLADSLLVSGLEHGCNSISSEAFEGMSGGNEQLLLLNQDFLTPTTSRSFEDEFSDYGSSSERTIVIFSSKKVSIFLLWSMSWCQLSSSILSPSRQLQSDAISISSE